jgi:hypothetical protein
VSFDLDEAIWGARAALQVEEINEPGPNDPFGHFIE